MLSMQGGNYSALVQGRRRVEIVNILETEPYFIVEVKPVQSEFRMTKQLTALMRTTRSLFERCVELNESIPEEAQLFSININDPSWLADMIATSLSLPNDTRKELMSLTHPADRLKKVNQILADELEVLELEDEIQAQVQTEVDRSHREYYLREQMRAIQSELGEGDIWSQEIGTLAKQIGEQDLPEQVLLQANRELQRLQQMPQMAPEVGIIRTYLDWLLEVPWTKMTEDNLDVLNAVEVLERDHFGLNKAKDRIIEYIAIRSLNPKRQRQPILCFVGPPGTGKTSLGKSIANAWDGSSSGYHSVAFGMKLRSAAIAEPISARCRAGSSKPCGGRNQKIRCSCWMKLTNWALISGAILLRPCLRFWTRNKTMLFQTITLNWILTFQK